MKRKRLLLRMFILLLLFTAIGFALYQNLFAANSKEVVQVNKPAANFKLTQLNGEPIELKQLKGKAVLVNFWGSWCEPCKNEMPSIQEAYNHYKKDKFEIVAVNVQESDIAVKSFMKSYGLSFPIALDKEGEVYRSWEIFNLPTSVFINPDGIIERNYEGEMSMNQLDQWIRDILPNKS
ncbi:thiol-disulfide oxidoreductase ResA [Bacillus nakamurai]|uniref:thiol-disulfide oxidoreductase ResA n=1 Tax=Bacillus nakamurai TaxID=1793963 RepID=UPI0007785E45|nr:thiol-disulfide oxidoreductase ResA [Bacillus nakamurai]KXZ24137.1 thiol-disulfide oxidoreductase ResA [Bacillus nakamurai]